MKSDNAGYHDAMRDTMMPTNYILHLLLASESVCSVVERDLRLTSSRQLALPKACETDEALLWFLKGCCRRL